MTTDEKHAFAQAKGFKVLELWSCDSIEDNISKGRDYILNNI